jgi:hypothetical protein
MNLPQRLRRSATIALIVSPTGLLFIAVIRLLIISNYNPVTASAIVSSGGYVDALLGTVIPLLPIFLPYLGLALLFFRRVIPGILALAASVLISPTSTTRSAAIRLARSDWQQLFSWAGTHPLIILPVALLAIGLLIATMGLGFTMFIRTLGTIVSVALLPYVAHIYPFPHNNNFYAQQLRQPWLPAETITLAGSHQKIIGYSLSSDSDWLVLLREDNRHVVYYRQSTVAYQQLCQIGSTREMRPLVTLTATPASVPICRQSNPGQSRPLAANCPPTLRPPVSPIGIRRLGCGRGLAP